VRVPVRSEDCDLWVEVRDRLIRAVGRISFVYNDFIRQRQVMFEHVHDVVVLGEAVADEGIDGEFHGPAAPVGRAGARGPVGGEAEPWAGGGPTAVVTPSTYITRNAAAHRNR